MIIIIIIMMMTMAMTMRMISLVFLIYTSFMFAYNTFVVPLENPSIVSLDFSRM